MARHLKAQARHSTVIAILIISECISYVIPIISKKNSLSIAFSQSAASFTAQGSNAQGDHCHSAWIYF